jgi:hypothetical protein
VISSSGNRFSSLVSLNITSDVLRVLRYGCFLILLYHLPLCYVRRLFTSMLELWAFLAALIFPVPLRTRPLHTAGTARRISRFRAADDFCQDPTLSWIRFFAPRRRRTKRSPSSCRSTACSVVPGFASNLVAYISR